LRRALSNPGFDSFEFLRLHRFDGRFHQALVRRHFSRGDALYKQALLRLAQNDDGA